MTVNNLNLFPNENISEHWEERKNGRESCFSVDNKEWDMVDFEAVGEVSYAGPTFVRVGDDDDFMSTVDQFLMEELEACVKKTKRRSWILSCLHTEDTW